MYYAHPDNPSVRYAIDRPGKQQMPDGNWVLTSLDTATAEKFGLMPVEVEAPVVGDDETLNGEIVTVEADRILVTRRKRKKSVDELAAEARAERDIYAELDDVKSRLDALWPTEVPKP